MGSPTTTGTTGFQFITSVNTIKRDDETRKRVRSHARRQKLPNEPASKQPAQKRASQKERVSKFRLNKRLSAPTSLQTPPKSASPPSDPAPTDRSPTRSILSDSTLTDPSPTTYDVIIEEIRVEKPDVWKTDMITNELAFTVAAELPSFSVLPIRTTPLTDKLFKWMICVCLSPQEKFVQKWFDRCGAPAYFNTYHSSFLALAFSMNPQGNWFDFITVDPAMTHGFMGLVAAMHCALAEWDDMTTIDFHRYEAVKYINERLNLEGRDDATVSDGVIVSVSLLVHVEAFIGSLPAARAHLMGLRKMVELRGGILDGFGHSTILQRALTWADFAYTTAAQSPLSFPFIPGLASTLDIHNRFLSRSMMINTISANHGGGLTIRNRETIELFELLYSTSVAVNTFDFDKLDSLQTKRGQMSDSVYMVEYRLCTLEDAIRLRGSIVPSLSPNGVSDDQALMNYNHPTDLSDALVYASHLYLHMALRGQPPQAKGHRLLVEALMSSLCHVVISLNLLSDTWPTATEYPPTQSLEYSVVDRSLNERWLNPNGEYHVGSSDSTPDSSREETRDELHEDILLWILFVGSCARVPLSHSWDGFGTMTDCRSFFLSSLRRYCLTRGILDREVLTLKLRDIVWLDSWGEKQVEMIWARIGTELGI
ncbi:hypothetical protein AB5N19_02036 [Seiridium cardinale]|uniref:Tachykinin family protein n=1 Tax=Seiridium cardinale TaxID=138064 RepID=A0ABR2XN92_9PEZI